MMRSTRPVASLAAAPPWCRPCPCRRASRRLHFADAVGAGEQIAEFVEAELRRIGRRRRRDAGRIAVASSSSSVTPPMPCSVPRVEHAVVAAVVIDPAGDRGERNLGGVGDRAGRAVGVVVVGEYASFGRSSVRPVAVVGGGEIRRRTRPNTCREREVDVAGGRELADHVRPLKFGAFDERIGVDVAAVDELRFVGIDARTRVSRRRRSR